VDIVEREYNNDNVIFCTIDAWILVNLTGKIMTDVTNASRTMLVDIKNLEYSSIMLGVFDIKRSALPDIKPNCFDFGNINVSITGLPESLQQTKIACMIGDQQSATLGQLCVSKGDTKCTYGTGAFLIANTGIEPIFSKNGLLTTPCFKLGIDEPAYFGLEGSIAVCAVLINWLKDNMGIISSPDEINTKARKVETSSGLILVPAFAGLFAPYWRTDARGILIGLTQ